VSKQGYMLDTRQRPGVAMRFVPPDRQTNVYCDVKHERTGNQQVRPSCSGVVVVAFFYSVVGFGYYRYIAKHVVCVRTAGSADRYKEARYAVQYRE
jgi:hypothetical protein